MKALGHDPWKMSGNLGLDISWNLSLTYEDGQTSSQQCMNAAVESAMVLFTAQQRVRLLRTWHLCFILICLYPVRVGNVINLPNRSLGVLQIFSANDSQAEVVGLFFDIHLNGLRHVFYKPF